MAHPPKHQTQLRRQLFVSCGLSEKEALVYDVLLSAGACSGADLERHTGLKKNTYALLASLAAKKLVTRHKTGARWLYRPAPPSVLAEIVDRTTRDLSQTKSTLTTMLPDLTSAYRVSVDKPVVRLYEGQEGLKEVFTDIYGPHGGDNVVWGCVDIERVDVEFPKHLQDTLIPLRLKNKWIAKSVFVDDEGGRALHADDAKQLRESALVDGADHPMPAEIDVYDDKITMISFERQEFVGLVIQNQAFADTLRSIFKLAFAKAKDGVQAARSPQREEPTKA
jgi:predicted transcriptional regulator